MTDRRIGLGVIGVGAIGKMHAQNIATSVPNARLAAVADVNLEAAKKVAATLGVTNVYADYRQLLNDREVDAVLLATPPFLKKEITLAAAESHKEVFCEKPMATTMKDADEMVGSVEKAGVTFQVGYQRRFDASYVRVRDAIERGELGKLLLIREHNRDPPTTITGWSADPKKSGGIFLDTLSHDFDIIRWLSASEVVRISADGNAMMYEELRKNGDYDTVVVNLKLASGAMGQIDACYHTPYGFDAKAEIVGTLAGAAISMGEKTSAHILRADGISNEFYDYWGSRWAQAYRDEVTDFVECILHDRQPRATVRDGRAAMEIGLAGWESIKSQRAVAVPSH
jgi:predicted dehydrogenase